MTSKSVVMETLKAKLLVLHGFHFYQFLKPQKLLKTSEPGSHEK